MKVVRAYSDGEVGTERLMGMDWNWDWWIWPKDELVEMRARILQVSRFALGATSPLNVWHPIDGQSAIRRAMTANRGVNKKVKIEIVNSSQEFEYRGWIA